MSPEAKREWAIVRCYWRAFAALVTFNRRALMQAVNEIERL